MKLSIASVEMTGWLGFALAMNTAMRQSLDFLCREDEPRLSDDKAVAKMGHPGILPSHPSQKREGWAPERL